MPGFNVENNQTFAGIMEVVEEDLQQSTLLPRIGRRGLYRLDKDEFSNGMATVRNNLIRIMEKDLFKALDIEDLSLKALRQPSSRHLQLTVFPDL
jgi:DNA replication ATP-dependent helicase Dna2